MLKWEITIIAVLTARWAGTDHLLLPSDCFKDYRGVCRAYDAE